jgi:hypothetical protein
MPNLGRVYQVLEPTFTAPGCTSLIAGEGLHHPVFIPATARPLRAHSLTH